VASPGSPAAVGRAETRQLNGPRRPANHRWAASKPSLGNPQIRSG
jgi:hypothetical protein